VQERTRPESKRAIAARVARHRIRKRRLADWKRATGEQVQALTRAQELALNAWHRERGTIRPWRYPLICTGTFKFPTVRNLALAIPITPELATLYLELWDRECRCRQLPGDENRIGWGVSTLSEWHDRANRARLRLPIPGHVDRADFEKFVGPRWWV
jgi:hypothetical protein